MQFDVMPCHEARGAQALMQRITSVLELNNPFCTGNELSMAMGSATCMAGASMDMTVQAADHAMYRAKAAHGQARHIERRHGFEIYSNEISPIKRRVPFFS